LSPTTAQLGLLLSSFALMSIGAGGIRACSLAFGADQFNETDNLKKEKILQSFFNWYYVSVGISIMLSVTVIVYIQDVAGWVVGFAVPVGLMLFSAVTFLLGTCLYIKVKANKSLFTGFAQVTMAAWKNRHLDLPPKISDGLYYHKGSNLTMPTDKIRYIIS
jgi:peptide/histidine transporter 3/4